MPQCSFIVKEDVWNLITVKLLDDMKGKVSLTASATPEYPHILQKLGVRDSKEPFFLIIKDCAEIDWAFGFVFRWERKQDIIVKIAKSLIGG